jgi:hypothetical protein
MRRPRDRAALSRRLKHTGQQHPLRMSRPETTMNAAVYFIEIFNNVFAQPAVFHR